MTVRLGRSTLLVDDYDEALAFYADVLGFEVAFDAELANGFRAVHVVPEGEEAGLWFMETDEDDLIGSQTGDFPCFVLYADDCRSTYGEWHSRGVRFHGEPTERDGDVVVHFEDCYGNEIVLVELGD